MVGCGEEVKKEVLQEEERRLAAIKVEEERKQEAQREELRVRDTSAAFAKLGDSFTISDLGLEMLWVKHGTFTMGSPVSEAERDDDEIQNQVTLTKGFYLGKYEVTQAQWERVMGNNPSYSKGADRPVEQVSWNDAVEFCKKLTEMEKKAGRVPQGMSYQLPTEAQWEYACRAGTTTRYSWGDSISSKNASYDRYLHEETTPVGKYPANPWGFHDIHGNVWEWCSDWYGGYPSGSVTNPIGQASGWYRVKRGGSWIHDGAYLRSANREDNSPSRRIIYIGFRVGFQSSK
jgi:sulfatase modifying factor 1